MSTVIYAIVFSGEIVEGFQIISVKAHMAKMLKADATKMQALFSGKPVVLKRTEDKAEAAKYGSALKKIGADVRVKIIKSDKPLAKKVAKPAAPKIALPDTSGLSLAPLEGNIVEPAPAPEPPAIDLSNLSVAENDGSPLVEPTPVEPVEVEIGDLSVAENDGSPLVEPTNEPAPVVDAPDFGLDEPGAVLETIKEEVEEVNPDISGISLAFPGSDLLNPEEKDPGPPPVSPDTSKLSVVSVSDS